MRILLVDDERIVNRSIGDFLRERGHNVTYCDSPVAALARFRCDEFDAVITDIRMPGMSGIDLARELKTMSPDASVIVITGHGDVELAIAALRAGAVDFLRKPIDLAELLIVIERVARVRALGISNQALQAEVRTTRESHSGSAGHNALIGENDCMARIREAIERIAHQQWSTVLLTGESGTGKELAARMLHDLGDGAETPFIAVNCSAITPSLAESELFGHEKGAFTGATRLHKGLIELAAGGTLFLDEIGDLAPELQARLLRVLEERTFRRVGGERTIPVHFRLVSATNRDLVGMSDRGEFRRDLLYRLNVVMLRMPALREHPDDIPRIAERFLVDLRARHARPGLRISEEAVEALATLGFPGNVRELKNMIEQAVLISDRDELTASAFPALMSEKAAPEGAPHSSATTLAEREAAAIREALEASRGNMREAALRLGIGYGALRYRMSRIGM